MNATAMKEIPPPLQMLQLISGFWVSRCIYVAAKLGVPDLLKDGTKSADVEALHSGAPRDFRS